MESGIYVSQTIWTIGSILNGLRVLIDLTAVNVEFVEFPDGGDFGSN